MFFKLNKMKITNSFLILFFAVFLCFSTTLEAINSTTNSQNSITSVFDLPMKDVLEKDKASLENQIGRKLTFREKIALKSVKKRLKKGEFENTQAAYNESRVHGLAVASMVCGIIGLFIFGIILGTLATIFGAISISKIKKSGGFLRGKGMAIAGLIMGIVGLVGFLVLLAIL